MRSFNVISFFIITQHYKLFSPQETIFITIPSFINQYKENILHFRYILRLKTRLPHVYSKINLTNNYLTRTYWILSKIVLKHSKHNHIIHAVEKYINLLLVYLKCRRASVCILWIEIVKINFLGLSVSAINLFRLKMFIILFATETLNNTDFYKL